MHGPLRSICTHIQDEADLVPLACKYEFVYGRKWTKYPWLANMSMCMELSGLCTLGLQICGCMEQSGRRFGTSKKHLSPTVAYADVCSKAVIVIDSLLIVTPIVGFCNCFIFCCALLCVHSSFALILMGKRELVALLCFCSWCIVIVVWFFLTVPRVCLQFVIVVFPDHHHHTHLLYFSTLGMQI